MAVGLDGRPIPLRRVRRRRLQLSNVAADDPTLMEVRPEDEWAAFDRLPTIIQAYLRDVMPIDQSACAVLDQWLRAERRGASPGDFVRYLEYVSVQYLNATASAWPTPPPRVTRVPR